MSKLQPNRKGKANKYKIHKGLYDVYRTYKGMTDSPVDYKTFRDIIRDLNSSMVDAMIYDSTEINLPYRMGELKVMKQLNKGYDSRGNIRKQPVDWRATLNYWEKLYPDKTMNDIKQIEDKPYIYHDNYHTDGYVHSFVWKKLPFLNLKGSSAYKFIIVRKHKQKLKKWINDPFRDTDYPEFNINLLRTLKNS